MQPPLRELQASLARLITARDGVEQGLAFERELPDGRLDTLIVGDPQLSAVDRIGIYANAYFYRLLDAIKEDFPVTLAAIGDAEFHNLITAYLVEYPPQRPSINDASQNLATFVHGSQVALRRPFLHDLVRVERAFVEVFLGADAKPLGFEDLRPIAPDQWPLIQMRSHPSLQVLECEWRIDTMMRAFRADTTPPQPGHERTSILLWRKNCEVDCRALDEAERAAFAVLRKGGEFAAVCAAITAHTSDAGAPAVIKRMLSRWLADELLVRA